MEDFTMKRVLIGLIGLLMALPALAGLHTAPYSYDFAGWSAVVDDWTNSGTGNYTTGHTAPNSVKFDGSGDYIISPTIDNPDQMKVWLKGNSTSTPGIFKIYARQGGGSWVMIRECTWGSGMDIPNGSWGPQIVIDLGPAFEGQNDVDFQFVYELKNAGNVALDDFEVTAYSAGAETDAHLLGCVGGLATISSLVDTQPERQIVLHFETQDAGVGTLNTIINGITITQGDANTVANWTQVIAGAELYELTLGGPWIGTVNNGSIVFTGSPMATMPNGGPVFEWDLYIWLKPLPYWADNEILEFHVDPTSFAVDPLGSLFDPADLPCESGDLNNKIDIVGTQLSIVTQPPANACKDQSFTMWVGFTDENGGVDEDWPSENITLSVNTGTGVLSSASGLTKASTNGESGWTDLKYNVAEAGVILQAVSVSFPTPVLSNAITFTTCPTIVCDAYPLCWDGNTGNDAVPFVVHISISDWTAAAGQDVYVKTYNGSANPYHYTDANGWSNNTAYTHKPIVTLDANGNWSGWLALKSSGMSTVRPRAALVSSTGTNITGDLFTGTLLDLVTNGVIVKDADGVASNGDPGNIVLVRNGGGDILGSWIIEDNGYPLDDGGSAIAAGGWRMAMCDVCEDVTFESWAPATWPNGYDIPSFFDVVEDFCPTPGSTVELDDVVLPVNLLSFTAAAGDGEVTLNWTTASEQGNDYFIVLRDNSDVIHVPSRGDAATGYEYSWTDDALTNGTTYSYTLIAVSLTGDRAELETVEATPTENAATITEYALHQNYPNPFNPSTQIGFDLVESGIVTLKVYNLMGQTVATLASGSMTAGSHVVSFDATNLTSGVYLYRIEVNGFAAEKKMLLMK